MVFRSPTLKSIATDAPNAIAPLMKNAITILCGTTFSEFLTSSPACVRLVSLLLDCHLRYVLI